MDSSAQVWLCGGSDGLHEGTGPLPGGMGATPHRCLPLFQQEVSLLRAPHHTALHEREWVGWEGGVLWPMEI